MFNLLDYAQPMNSYMAGQKNLVALLRRCAPPHTELEHDLAIEQQSTYISMSGTMGVVNALNSMAVAIAFFLLTHSFLIFVWLAVVNVFSVTAWQLHRKADTESRPVRTRAHILFLSEKSLSILATIWALPVLFFASLGFEALIFVSLVVTGTAAGFASIMSTVPRIVVRFVAFSILPVIAALSFFAGPTGHALSVLGLAFIVITTKGSLMSFAQLQRVVLITHEARQAKRNLSDAIEALHDGFAIYGPDGDLQMSNSRFRQWFPNEALIENDGDDKIRQVGEGRWVKRSVVPVSDGRRVSIHTDVTDLKNRERELIAARREAEEANAAKGRFLSTMSQELRTPLDIINGFSRLMKGDSQLQLSPEEIADYAGSIHAAGEHLLTVVNDIIEFSKVGAERYLHDPVEVDLRDLLATAVSLSAGFQRLTSLEGIDVSVSSRIGSIVVDEMAFRRILMNLVTNAIQHGGEPVNISIRAFLRADGAPVVTIRDFGRGLPGSELERVFEPFYQSQPQRAGEFSGTGLGLTLSRELARLHGGDVLLSSREGAGTTASIVLPASAHIPPEFAEPALVSGDALGQGEAA